ncbi:MAG: hypothetical protein AB199_00415 [Parcubacteria bacterium C7867-004]|nr:MAG: hypothetical protein AB199_00415 [Parcubacteria bacterium C7867-004]
MNRRVLIIIAGVIVILGLVAALWFFVFAPGAKLNVDVTPFTPSGDRAPDDSTDVGPVQGAGVVVAPRLLRITDGPVAKGVAAIYLPPVIISSSATSTATSSQESKPAEVEVRYIERQSGNVFSFLVHDRLLTRISNRTLPGVQEAAWTSDGKRAFAQFLTRANDGTEHVDTYSLPTDGSENDGYFLEQNLSQIIVRGTSTVFSLLPSSNGSTGTVSAPDGTGTATVFTSALAQLRASFSGGDFVLATKASKELDGYAFLVSRANGSFVRLLGPLRGLTTLADPTGTSVLFSYVDKGTLYTQIMNIATRTVTPLPLATIADKCAWEAGGRGVYCGVPTTLSKASPDDWYQGAYAFTDRLWRVDLDTRLATLIVDPLQVGDVEIDAVALTVDRESDVLIFTNQRDGSLWSYDL